MEASEGGSAGVTVIGAEAPSAYHVAPRTENPSEFLGPSSLAMDASPVSVGLGGLAERKKRGRPRKYGPDGTPLPLSPMPISSSVPTSGRRRAKSRGRGFDKFYKRMGMETYGDIGSGSVGTNFTPHVITVAAGEDVTMKVISFSQQGPRAICILSANGVISNVTLRQPDSSGGTLTYEGRFEILSLSGSFMPTESQGTRGRSGGMSVSLASPDGRVVGGGVAGLLIAASPVQVVVGSFLVGDPHDTKAKKQKRDPVPSNVISFSQSPAFGPASTERDEGVSTNVQQTSSALEQNMSSAPSPFHRESWANGQEQRSSATDINISLPAG